MKIKLSKIFIENQKTHTFAAKNNTMKRILIIPLTLILMSVIVSCGDSPESTDTKQKTNTGEVINAKDNMTTKLSQYASYTLQSDVSHLSDNQRKILKYLFEVAQIMDDLYWQQNLGDKKAFLQSIKDPATKQYAIINYGPWDELDGLKPFVKGWGPKPAGANFYPHDMTKEEFEKFENKDKKSQYTILKRDTKGNLQVQWYHEAYAGAIEKAATLLEKAAALADNQSFGKYLKLRAKALRTDDYFESDMAWLDVQDNDIDFVVGPIENYTDALFGYKTAFESFILIKDRVWSERLQKYAKFLPQLQKELPVDPKYKQDVPGSNVDLNAYDAVYYAGDCNNGSKTIAINLPNDERVQLQKGSRKLQLKNAMRAKFEKILVPIANILIAPGQRKHIKFDAFFANTMFHEVAHGMGVKNTINGKGTARIALKEQYSALEEGKADILGLYLVTKLNEMGEYKDVELMDNYVTFMASIFRSVRFGASSAHGKANMIRFNFFKEKGAFTKNEDGTYAIDFEKMKAAATQLTQIILKLQGDGDYEGAKKLVSQQGIIKQDLQKDLDRLTQAGIPVDVTFKQGYDVLFH